MSVLMTFCKLKPTLIKPYLEVNQVQSYSLIRSGVQVIRPGNCEGTGNLKETSGPHLPPSPLDFLTSQSLLSASYDLQMQLGGVHFLFVCLSLLDW